MLKIAVTLRSWSCSFPENQPLLKLTSQFNVQPLALDGTIYIETLDSILVSALLTKLNLVLKARNGSSEYR